LKVISWQSAISYYNLNENQQSTINSMIETHQKIVKGDQWYAGDHCAFALKGIPCLAVTSSDLFEGALEYTHTPKDTLNIINSEMIATTAKFLLEVINNWIM
jgi:aminopeptidase YwaD